MPSEPSPAPGSFLLLLLAVAVLGLGPLIFVASSRWRWLLALVDGFVLASVGTLAALFVLPAAIDEAGLWAIGFAGAGLLLPTFLEDISTRHRLVHGVGIALALAGLLVHTITDGVALVTAGADDAALVVAVVLHRLPVGIAAWWIVRPLYGPKGAWAVLALEGGGTVVGFFLGGSEALALEGAPLGLLQAFVAGALLHVVIHRSTGGGAPAGRWRVGETLGAVLGGALVSLVPHRHAHSGGHEAHEPGVSPLVGEYAQRFFALLVDVAPFLLAGTLVATALVLVLPRAPLEGEARGGRLPLALRGAAYGVALPICSNGVLSTYRQLLAGGTAPLAALAFLVASPLLGVESLLLSLPLLGGELTAARLLSGVLLAVVVALVVGASRASRQRAPGHDDGDEHEHGGHHAHHHHDHPHDRAHPHHGELLAERRSLPALRLALREVVDESAAWILLGLAVLAAAEPSSLSAWFAGLPAGSDVVLVCLVGVPVYLNASGATALAAALLLAGASPGAALGLLLIGPSTSVPAWSVLARLHGRAAAVLYTAVVVAGGVALGWTLNALLPSSAAALGGVLDGGGALAQAALVVLVALYAAALLRQGPRRFLGALLAHSHREHDHPSPQQPESAP